MDFAGGARRFARSLSAKVDGMAAEMLRFAQEIKFVSRGCHSFEELEAKQREVHVQEIYRKSGEGS